MCPEVYRIKATCFLYHIEEGNWGTCNIRQLFASQNGQYFDVLITFSEGTSYELNIPSNRLNMLTTVQNLLAVDNTFPKRYSLLISITEQCLKIFFETKF